MLIKRILKFIMLASLMLGILSVVFWLTFAINSDALLVEVSVGIKSTLIKLYFALSTLIGMAAWWHILQQENHSIAEIERKAQNARLDNEITERKNIQDTLNRRTKELALHNDILTMIGQGGQLSDICLQIVLRIEELHNDMRCSILLMDEEGKHLLHTAAPSLPAFYNQAVNGVAIGEGVGSCGTASFLGERVIVENIQQHPYWQNYLDLAAKANLKSCWSEPFKNNQGKVLGTFAIYHDYICKPSAEEIELISHYANFVLLAIERNQSEQNLRLAATAFQTQQAIVIADVNCIIKQVNLAFISVTGYLEHEVVGKPLSVLKSGCHDNNFYELMWQSINDTGSWQGELWGRRKNGEVYPKWITITAVQDANNEITHYVSVQTDITERKAAEDEIRNLAFYDPLTKLPNRRLLRDRLQQAQVSNARNSVYGAIFFIDLDNFKTLNDTLGHDKGDNLLKQVAVRLSNCVRECDTVARLGGDEFVVMIQELSVHVEEAAIQAENVGEKILSTLNQAYQLDDHDYFSTPSIGVTLFSDQQSSIEELLVQSDIAMYQAKASGRNTLRFFDATMQASINARASLEEDLRTALQNNEFRLYYQPQVNAKGKIIGAEALIRWCRQSGEWIMPNQFITLAEETGLIIPIGLWVLETACQQLVFWSSHTVLSELTLSVNVSVRQFRQINFVADVQAVLQQTGAKPDKLKLELTESLLAADMDDIITKMQALKQLGVAFSLDDFGTGYSSLYYLKQLPLDQLKIDQSFVRDILIDSNDAAIAKMIIALADAMALTVIAEGVEVTEQQQYLSQLGCYEFQGYLYGKPVTADALEKLILV